MQIQDLQSKLDEQLKLNETLCKRLFELKMIPENIHNTKRRKSKKSKKSMK